MEMRMKRIIVFLGSAALALSAQAGFYTGANISQWSAANDRVVENRSIGTDFQDSSMFQGYVTSIADTFDGGTLFCIPVGATAGQLIAVVSKYVKEHPERWSENGARLVQVSFVLAFPCEGKFDPSTARPVPDKKSRKQ